MPHDPHPDGSYRGLAALQDDAGKDAPFEVCKFSNSGARADHATALGNPGSGRLCPTCKCAGSVLGVQVVFKVPRLEAHVEDGQDHYTIVLPRYVVEEMRTQAAAVDLDGEESRECSTWVVLDKVQRMYVLGTVCQYECKFVQATCA
jgi:hypothetical protein